MSRGSIGTIQLVVIDIIEDKSPNTLTECLELIESQISMIRQLDEISVPTP